MAAGAATKNGVLGYVVPFPIPEVIRHANAFALGAQATHPGREGEARSGRTRGSTAAKEKKRGGEPPRCRCRTSSGRTSTRPATGQYAESQGIPWVGYDSDAQHVRAELVADGVGLQLGPVLPEARQGRDERHVEDGLLLRQHQGRLHRPRAVRAEASPRRRRRDRGEAEGVDQSGTFYEFAGPLYDQKGKLRVPKGKTLTVDDLYAMNWLVKGVIGSPKG